MKYYVGITDAGWFDYLRQIKPAEVNFWRPMAKTTFRAVDVGAPFLFKLHKGDGGYIVGGGYFTTYAPASLSMAWSMFGTSNGHADFNSFRSSIASYREKRDLTTVDPEIGCIVLSEPFFFEEKDWILPPDDWGTGIMQGKTYDDASGEGRRIWSEVRALLIGQAGSSTPKLIRETRSLDGPIFGNSYLRKARLGQGGFRLLTLENYGHKCCITGETTVPVLTAAHIRPVSNEGDNALSNGLLMRADMHILYDKGLIGIDPEYRIRVSSQIREQYLNGKVYYAHDGEALRSLPQQAELQPDRMALEWHMDEVFVA